MTLPTLLFADQPGGKQGSDDWSFSSASEAFFGQVKGSPSEGVLVTWGRLGKHAGIQFMVSLVCLLSSRFDVDERKNSTGNTVFRYHLGVSTPICSSV